MEISSEPLLAEGIVEETVVEESIESKSIHSSSQKNIDITKQDSESNIIEEKGEEYEDIILTDEFEPFYVDSEL